jgi:DNA-binding transcriptional LysR family regulator
MDLRQLRYLVATADHGTMTAAARALHVAQPALSRSVKALEAELGFDVFLRVGRGLRLSDDGREVVARAREVLAAVERVEQLRRPADRDRATPLRLLCTPTVGAVVSERLLPGFYAAHPDATLVVLHAAAPAEVIEALDDGRAEVGFVDRGSVPPRFRNLPISRSEVVLVSPAGDGPDEPLAIADLAGVDLILPTKGSPRRAEFDALFAHFGITPHVVLETDDRGMGASFVLSGIGSLVTYDDQARRLEAQGARVRRFDRPLERTVRMVHRRSNLSDAARAFVRYAAANAEV